MCCAYTVESVLPSHHSQFYSCSLGPVPWNPFMNPFCVPCGPTVEGAMDNVGGIWKVGCGMWHVERGMWHVECGM